MGQNGPDPVCIGPVGVSVEDGHEEWRRNLFQALASQSISRNKFPDAFAQGWTKDVHRRFQNLRALKRDAEKFGGYAGTVCWVSRGDQGLRFHLHCPQLLYTRAVAVHNYELEWLIAQQGVRSLLDVKSLER